MKKLLYLTLPFLAFPALAQQQPYVSSGPAGGQARAFEFQSGRMLVGGRGGVYGRQGVLWNPLSTDWSSFSCATVSSLGSNANDLIAGTVTDGVYASTNAGATWTNITGDLRTGVEYRSVALSLPNYLAIRADSGVLYLSTDGISWVRRNFSIQNASARYLSVHNNNIYVTTSTGLFRSPDNGQSFMMQYTGTGVDGKMLWKNDTLWVAGSSGLRMSTDDGQSFGPALLAGRSVGSVAISGSNFLATVKGSSGIDSILYSANSGTSFTTVLPTSSIRFRNVYDLSAEAGYFLAGTDRGILYGNLNNTGWRSDDSGFHARQITYLSSGAAGTVMAVANAEGVFQTADSGVSWTASASAANGAEDMINAIESSNQNVYVAAANNFFRSTNGGQTFSAGATGLTAGSYSSVAVSKTDGSILLVRNGDVYRSTDNGASFTMLTTGIIANQARQVFCVDTSWFVSTATDSLYQAGSNLQFRQLTSIWGGITGVTNNTKAYYATTRTQGLFRSTDGLSWTPVAALSVIPAQLNAVASVDTTVYLGTGNGLISNRSGAWAADSLQGQIIYSLVSNSRKLYAGTCNGVWTTKNLPPPPPPVDTNVGVGTTAQQLGAFRLYPNPASSDFSAAFSASEAGTATLTMTDLTGRSVYEATTRVEAGMNVLPVPASTLQIAGGVYFLKVQTRSQQGVQRILIQRN